MRRYMAIGFIVFVFLGISAILARGLTGAGNEQSRVLDLLRAEARGDATAALRMMPACNAQPACVQVTRDRVASLKRPGDVQILNYQPSVRIALTRQVGTGRVAWRAGESLPVVQCVRVRRDGPLTGADVELLGISAPIGGEESC